MAVEIRADVTAALADPRSRISCPGERQLPMMHPLHRRILLDVLSLPTAPFAEGAVVSYIEGFCRGRRGLTLTRDAAGNILVHLRSRGRRVRRPVCLTAHLDHPGFVADGMIGPGRLRAVWRGGVRAEYFVGARVRFHCDGRWTRGRVRSITQCREGKLKRVNGAVIDVARPVRAGAPGMWDFPDAAIRGRRIRARGCDDLAGAAGMLCCIEEIVRGRLGAEAYFLFTRAEEVGFAGALAASRLKTVPRRCYVVAVETSSELPSARIGDGPKEPFKPVELGERVVPQRLPHDLLEVGTVRPAP